MKMNTLRCYVVTLLRCLQFRSIFPLRSPQFQIFWLFAISTWPWIPVSSPNNHIFSKNVQLWSHPNLWKKTSPCWRDRFLLFFLSERSSVLLYYQFYDFTLKFIILLTKPYVLFEKRRKVLTDHAVSSFFQIH